MGPFSVVFPFNCILAEKFSKKESLFHNLKTKRQLCVLNIHHRDDFTCGISIPDLIYLIIIRNNLFWHLQINVNEWVMIYDITCNIIMPLMNLVYVTSC